VKNYYTAKEFAKLCNVSNKTVFNWIKKGTVEAKQMIKRGRYYIPRLEVPTFLRKEEKKNA